MEDGTVFISSAIYIYGSFCLQLFAMHEHQV